VSLCRLDIPLPVSRQPIFPPAIQRQGAVDGRALRHPDNGHLPQVVPPLRETVMHLLHVLSRIERVKWIG
jgi:hypothetical protein